MLPGATAPMSKGAVLTSTSALPALSSSTRECSVRPLALPFPGFAQRRMAVPRSAGVTRSTQPPLPTPEPERKTGSGMAGDPRRSSVRTPGRPPPAAPRVPACTIPDSDPPPTMPGGARYVPERAPSLQETLPPEQRADQNLTPEVPGRYHVRREFGRGGMSVVYLAHDSHIGRDVALKELLPAAMEQMSDASGGDTSAPWARFVREARITGMLEHPSIVPVYEIERRDDGSLYYTQKLIRGHTLTEELKGCATARDRLRV